MSKHENKRYATNMLDADAVKLHVDFMLLSSPC